MLWAAYSLNNRSVESHLLHAAVHVAIPGCRRSCQGVQKMLRHVRPEWAAKGENWVGNRMRLSEGV